MYSCYYRIILLHIMCKKFPQRLILVILLSTVVDGQVVTPLPDGLLVEQGPVVSVEEGLWTPIVTIDDPTELYAPLKYEWIRNQSVILMDKVRSFEHFQFFDEHIKRAFVQWLRILIQPENSCSSVSGTNIICF